MRKLTVLGLLLLLLGGCAAKPSAPLAEIPARSGNYEAVAVICTPGLTATASVSQSPETCVVTFTEPASLAGMEYRFDRDSVDLTYRGQRFEFDPQAVPDAALARILRSGVEQSIRDSSPQTPDTDGDSPLTGMLEAGAFTLQKDPQSGAPLKLLLPDRDMEIEFAHFRFLD